MQQIVLIVVMAVIAVFSAIGGSYYQKQAFSRNVRSLAYYEETYLRKQGFTRGFGNYELLSFDGGKRWYAVERGEDGAVIIRGLADEVFPGLLSRLEGLDALEAYVANNGPITLSGERAETEKAILEAAGFTVTEK